jgi:hypothetical protein
MPGADVTIHAEFADYGIRYVTRYGAGDWDGTSWENASNDVQKMMDELAAASLDGTAGYTGPYIVKLGAGSHRPKYEPMVPANPAVLDNYAYNDSPEDARDRAFILRPGVQLWGGYPESGGNDDTRDPAANISILSGDLDNSGSTPNMNDAYHVVLGVDIPSGSGTLLDGLTISGGNADTSSPSSIITVGGLSIRKNNGGGMYNDSSSPTLTNVTISGNTAKATGGGMYNYDSSPELSEVTISGNTAAGGGGMCNESESSPALTNVTISGNKAIGDSSIGGGMYNYASSPVLNNVTIGGNEPTDKNTARDGGGMGNWNVSTLNIIGVMKISGNEATHGGGMYNFNSSLVLNSNVTISGNEAANLGGGVYNCGSSMTMNGGFITGNTADSGGGIYNDTSSLELNSNATISGNEATGDGGGVYNFYLSVTMNGGFITGNTADSDSSGSGDGGGVYMSGSSTEDFDMTDGTISGNTANTGGGVYVAGGTFTKSSGGGIIYGDTDTTHTSSANENTATSGNGHAVYVESGAKKRNTDAGSSVSLNSDNSNNWE